MAEATLIRKVTFRASHRYTREDWSAERNRLEFGELSKSHEHEYSVHVWLRGRPDPVTGFVVDLEQLDAVLREEVLEPLSNGDLNSAVPRFREGPALPSTENLAVWLYERLAARIPGTARLDKVRVSESPFLAAEYAGPAAGPG